MRIYAVTTTLSPPTVHVEHNGKDIKFSASVYQRDSFTPPPKDTFEFINKYWQTLDDKLVNYIFSIYEDINDMFLTIYNKEDLLSNLESKACELIDLHDLEHIKSWILYDNVGINIPNMLSSYVEDIDRNTSREKTYLRNDYVKLLALSVALRSLIPVWGEYIASIRKQTGNSFKEYQAFKLIQLSRAMTSEPMEKLLEYIEHTVGDKKFSMDRTLADISSENYPYWLLANTCVKKICIGDITGEDPSSNLITLVYRFIIQKTNAIESNYAEVVKEKLSTSNDDRSEGNAKISAIERFKISSDRTILEIEAMRFAVEDPYKVASIVDKTIPKELVDKCLNVTMSSTQLFVEKPQQTLLAWTLKKAISPRAICYFDKKLLNQCLGVSAAYLWHKNFKYISSYLLAVSASSEEGMLAAPMPAMARIPKDILDELDKKYPYQSSQKIVATTNINPAMLAINNLVTELNQHYWLCQAPKDMLEQATDGQRKIQLASDIKIDLAKMLLAI